MANLKGAYSKEDGYSKQLKDLHHRLAKFGVKRFNTTSKGTHSSALSKKRSEYSKSFASFIQNKGLDGKLNHHMTNKNIKFFLEQRVQNLSRTSKENYYRGFSSMLQGLQQANITMSFDKSIIDKMVIDLKKENPKQEIKIRRAIENSNQVIEKISNENFIAGVLSRVQLVCGVRLSESYAIIKDFNKLYNSKIQQIVGLKGKGNHIYMNKDIPFSLVIAIKSIANEKLLSKKTYHNILKKFGIKSHSWRYTFSKNLFYEKLKELSYQDTLSFVSKALGHKRKSMTRYYLCRT